MRRIAPALLLSALAAAGGCLEDSESRAHLEPFEVDAAIFACGAWSPAAPEKPRALFDVHFGRRLETDPDDGPLPEHLARIEALGGTVVHEFRVPMARAILATDSVPSLDANFVRGVPDAERTDVEVLISIATPLSAADVRFFDSVGAQILRVYDFDTILARVPDAALPEIRRRRGVGWVEVNAMGCLDLATRAGGRFAAGREPCLSGG